MPFKYPSMQERILANSHESEHWSYNGIPCRIWDGATSVNRAGMRYGKISVRIKRGPRKGKVRSTLAHREAIKAFTGRRLPARCVGKHLCNMTLCVEPRHLVGGTQRSNVRQCVEEGRHGNQHRAPVRELEQAAA